jgi:hypothetical protein
MTSADMAGHHAAQAKHFHELAQIAKRRALEAKTARKWLDKLKLDEQAREYRNTRDHHKGKASHYRALA